MLHLQSPHQSCHHYSSHFLECFSIWAPQLYPWTSKKEKQINREIKQTIFPTSTSPHVAPSRKLSTEKHSQYKAVSLLIFSTLPFGNRSWVSPLHDPKLHQNVCPRSKVWASCKNDPIPQELQEGLQVDVTKGACHYYTWFQGIYRGAL